MTYYIKGVAGNERDRVWIDGKEITPKQSYKYANHSPDGFAWGYTGSGPSQLALAILLAAGIEPKIVIKIYHEFKFDFLAKLDMEKDFELTVDIEAWVDKQKRKLGI